MASRFAKFRQNLNQQNPTSKGLEQLCKQAQSTGVLNLANRELSDIPDIVFKINHSSTNDEVKEVDMSKDRDDTPWWEIKLLNKLLLTSNQIKTINPSGLKELYSLTVFDIRDNELQSLPDEIEVLENLQVLNISVNKLTCLPKTISSLQKLTYLDASVNLISEVDDKLLSNLSNLKQLNFDGNKLTKLPECVPMSLRLYTASENKLVSIPDGYLQSLPNLQVLDLSKNKLEHVGLVKEPTQDLLPAIHLHNNHLTEIPYLAAFTQLKEATLLYNRISTINEANLEGLNELISLDLSHNGLTTLPESIATSCPNLKTLKLTNNDLENLPLSLGKMSELSNLGVSGNPLRTIKQSIIAEGTQAVKNLLIMRQTNPTDINDNVTSPADSGDASGGQLMPSSGGALPGIQDCGLPRVNASGVLQWSVAKPPPANRRNFHKATAQPKILPLPSDSDWRPHALQSLNAESSQLREVDLSGRELHNIPEGLFSLSQYVTCLNLSGCKLEQLSAGLSKFKSLFDLDLSRNSLSSLPDDLAECGSLRVLRLDMNTALSGHFTEVPWSQQPFFKAPLCAALECLSLRGCKLTACPDPEQMLPSHCPMLATLDLSDNDIADVPAKLGLCTQIKSLSLDGNMFRTPRPAIIAKGTPAVLEYLQSRIVPE